MSMGSTRRMKLLDLPSAGFSSTPRVANEVILMPVPRGSLVEYTVDKRADTHTYESDNIAHENPVLSCPAPVVNPCSLFSLPLKSFEVSCSCGQPKLARHEFD